MERKDELLYIAHKATRVVNHATPLEVQVHAMCITRSDGGSEFASQVTSWSLWVLVGQKISGQGGSRQCSAQGWRSLVEVATIGARGNG